MLLRAPLRRLSSSLCAWPELDAPGSPLPAGALTLVSPRWLSAAIAAGGADAPVVLDASWYLPAAGRDARAEFAAGAVPGARRLDLDAVCDAASPLPHMLPPLEHWARAAAALRLTPATPAVIYDGAGMFSAARAWWMFRVMGHTDVAVLNGGLKKWKAEGRPLTSDAPSVRSNRHFTPRLDTSLVRDIDDIKGMVATSRTNARITPTSAQIVDARSAGRFAGRDPEPRPGLRTGHIPGSRNVPFTTLLKADGTLKPAAELTRIFEAAGLDLKRPIVTSCGSGVTACVLSLALAQVGRPDAAVYDGSWSEWAQEKLRNPVATGEA